MNDEISDMSKEQKTITSRGNNIDNSELSNEHEEENDQEEENDNGEENDDEDEEENDDDDDDEDDNDDEEEEKSSIDYSEKKKKEPYHAYLNSKIENSNYLHLLEKGDYIYNKEQNKFYKIVKNDENNLSSSEKKKEHNIVIELIDNLKSKSKKEKYQMKKMGENIILKKASNKEINEKKDEENNNLKENEGIEEKKDNEKNLKENIEEKDANDKNKFVGILQNEIKNQINKKEDNNNENKEKDIINIKNNEIIKEKENNKGKKINEEKLSINKNIKTKNLINITIKDYSKYTFLQKIKIFYINYLNISYSIKMLININCSIKELVNEFSKLYHIPTERFSEKSSISFFINGKKYSSSNDIRKKFFIPNKFDYKNDYIILMEKGSFNFAEIDMGTRNNYYNLKEIKIPHFVYSSYYNYLIESFIISKNLTTLECELYEIKKEAYLKIEPNNEKSTRQKIKEFLDLNWKERTNFICTIKSGNIKKSKENYDANCFEINRKFILTHGKMYIFLITSSNKKMYVFNPRHISKEGLFIVSKDNKSILNGFKAKKISDFIA